MTPDPDAEDDLPSPLAVLLDEFGWAPPLLLALAGAVVAVVDGVGTVRRGPHRYVRRFRHE